jgi:hypothetical protein
LKKPGNVEGRIIMEFIEKAKVRIAHWISHSEHHEEEYETFARELEGAGQSAAATHIREMIAATREGTDCLRRALEAIDNV